MLNNFPLWSRLRASAVLAALLAASGASHANVIDANTAASPFSGVVSINVQYGGNSFLCSGALIGARSVVTAGSCVDTNGNGAAVDLAQPGNVVTVVFNSNGDNTAQVNASRVTLNPDFQGFNVCPAAAAPGSTCLNDDLAVITLAQDAPASARVYSVSVNPVTSGSGIIMAGYGDAGDGVNPGMAGSSFTMKRVGANRADIFDADDEQNFAGPNEVFYADFDGNGVDSFCTLFGVCTGSLAPGVESTIGSGDIGGPVFALRAGELVLVGVNSFVGTFPGIDDGAFGSYFGGVLLASYGNYLSAATDGAVALVPEPGSVALLGLGVLLLAGARRRTRRY